MRFTSIAVLLAAAASAAAQNIQFTSVPEAVTPDQTYTIQWSPDDSVTEVNLQARTGSSNNLDEGTTIATNLQNTNTYQWKPSPSLFNSDDTEESKVTIMITWKGKDGKEYSNYSPRIAVSGATDPKNAPTTTGTDTDTTSTITSTIDLTTTSTMTSSDNATATDEESTTATETETETSTRTTRAQPTRTASSDSSTPSSPSGGSVASSSSLAMVFCVLAAVFYIN